MSAAPPQLASVSMDLDGARHYHAIHGLPPPSSDTLVARGLGRFLELCDDLQLKATLFVVTADLDDATVGRLLQQAHGAGHELASHSHRHAYDLSRQAPAQQQADLWRSAQALAAITGSPPRGFRAPGYNQSEALLDALEVVGFRYDSSFLASPAYFALRAAAIAAIALAGRRSASLVGDLRESMPKAPFRPRRGQRFLPARSRAEGRSLLELPISAPLGVPLFGMTLTTPWVARGLWSNALQAPAPCVVELHAIDLCGPDDVDPALRARQPETRRDVVRKVRALREGFTRLQRARSCVRLDALAEAVTAP